MTAIPEKIHQSGQKKATDSTIQGPTMQCHSQPIWKIIAEIGSQIPDEEWAKVPDDASISLKHYLYGEHRTFFHKARLISKRFSLFSSTPYLRY